VSHRPPIRLTAASTPTTKSALPSMKPSGQAHTLRLIAIRRRRFAAPQLLE
jgi:hypothetical protein